MRKLLAALAAACVAATLAAPAAGQRVSLGVKGGLNFADLKGSDVDQFNAKTYLRGMGGGFAVIEINKSISFQPELLYAQKGAKFTEEGLDGKLKLDYFELPVLFRFSVPTDVATKVVPNIFLGPTIAYKVDCKAAGTEGGVSVSFDCDDPNLDLPVRNWDYSAVIGAGADINVGNAAIVLDARYTYGLRKIDSSEVPDDVKNSAIAVMVGVKFNLSPSKLAILR